MRELDPRTHIIILLTATVSWFLYKNANSIHCFLILGILYMWQSKQLSDAVKLGFIYLVIQLIAAFFASKMAILYIILSTFARMIPLMMFAAVIVKSNLSRILLSYEKMHIPKSILIMICILIRFFPVLRKEMITIRLGIKARGIFLNWYDYFKHPLLAYESFFVPLTIRCIKLSDELGATAELRGLAYKGKRTSLYKSEFSYFDMVIIIIYALIMLTIYFKVRV